MGEERGTNMLHMHVFDLGTFTAGHENQVSSM